MLPCMFVVLISALIHRQINWGCLSVTVNTTSIFLCVVTNNAFLFFSLQSGRKFQDLILVDIWLVWSNLCCPQIRSQIHWEHWLCPLWDIQRHNGGGSAQHADCYDQQFISRNWGGLCSQVVLFCYAVKRAELIGIISVVCKKYKEEITTGKDITKCIKEGWLYLTTQPSCRTSKHLNKFISCHVNTIFGIQLLLKNKSENV